MQQRKGAHQKHVSYWTRCGGRQNLCWLGLLEHYLSIVRHQANEIADRLARRACCQVMGRSHRISSLTFFWKSALVISLLWFFVCPCCFLCNLVLLINETAIIALKKKKKSSLISNL